MTDDTSMQKFAVDQSAYLVVELRAAQRLIPMGAKAKACAQK